MAGFEWELEPDGGKLKLNAAGIHVSGRIFWRWRGGVRSSYVPRMGHCAFLWTGIAEILVDVLEEEQIIIFTSIANGITVH